MINLKIVKYEFPAPSKPVGTILLLGISNIQFIRKSSIIEGIMAMKKE